MGSSATKSYKLQIKQLSYPIRTEIKVLAYIEQNNTFDTISISGAFQTRRFMTGAQCLRTLIFQNRNKVSITKYSYRLVTQHLGLITRSDKNCFFSKKLSKIIRSPKKICQTRLASNRQSIFAYQNQYRDWDVKTGGFIHICDQFEDSLNNVVIVSPSSNFLAEAWHYFNEGNYNSVILRVIDLNTHDIIIDPLYCPLFTNQCSDCQYTPIYSPNNKLILTYPQVQVHTGSMIEVKDSQSLQRLWHCRSTQFKFCRISSDSQLVMMAKWDIINFHNSLTGQKIHTLENYPLYQERLFFPGLISGDTIRVILAKDSSQKNA